MSDRTRRIVSAAPRAAAAFRRVAVTRVGRPDDGRGEDVAATEEPLEIRLHGRPFAVIMRTPGHDRELAAGFLLAEAIVGSNDELGAVEHCRHPDHPEAHNIVDIYLLGDAAARLERTLEARRNILTTSSCGLCGRVTIESLKPHAVPLTSVRPIDAAMLARLPARLRERQAVFDETGGLHAAGVFTAGGDPLAVAEDVGRHNAVDKVVGALLLADRLPVEDAVLVVSGRASFEIVQKAWMAGVPTVCAVSAPSSLAIELAHEAGITLAGFARGGGFNLYSHAGRISLV
jgi:FdhD protein